MQSSRQHDQPPYERRKFGRFELPHWLDFKASSSHQKCRIIDISYGGLRVKGEFLLEEIYPLSIRFLDLDFTVQAICKSSLKSSGESGVGYVTDSLPATTTFMRKIIPFLELGNKSHQIDSYQLTNSTSVDGHTIVGYGPTILSTGRDHASNKPTLDFTIYEESEPPFRLALDKNGELAYFKNLEEEEECPPEAIRKALFFLIGAENHHNLDPVWLEEVVTQLKEGVDTV